jgi:hypothetical protein
MAITNTWAVSQMSAYPQADGQVDVVFNVAWTLSGTDGTYSSSVYGSQLVTYTAGSPYTPYDQLTQDQVIGWVKDAMGTEQVASFEAIVANGIANQVNPPVVTPPLPWAEAVTLPAPIV